MRKLSVLALVVLFVTGSAFATSLTRTPNATFAAGTGALAPTTTNNDDSCDIGTAPAATLLLPYFQVDLGTAGTGRTTIFSVTNVSPYSQIAHVVVWTDWSFPVLDFNIFLTGYDTQPINLYDVIARGLIGSTTGTGIGSTASYNARTASVSPGVVVNAVAQPNRINGAGTISGTNPNAGTQPFSTQDFNGGNPNFSSTAATSCAAGRLPGQLPQALANDVKLALSTGIPTGAAVACVGPAGSPVGSNHGSGVAIGYVTIDVAATCSVFLPTDPGYFASTDGVLFDNVLIGDYQDINQSSTAGNYAGGNPLVHIRAIPEGGAGGTVMATNLPYTFYDRYTVNSTGLPRTIDRRQPLPSAFAARWISGSTAAFDTSYKVWREGFTGSTNLTLTGNNALTCGAAGVELNSAIPFTEIVRFDEHENGATIAPTGGIIVSPPPVIPTQGTPETSEIPISGSVFPVVAGSTDVGGWTYFNLNNGGDATMTNPTGLNVSPQYSAQRTGFTIPTTGSPTTPIPTEAPAVFYRDVSQNWVILQMFAEGRYGVDQDANWLGNGCSAPFPATSAALANSAVGRIAPAGGVLVCSPPNPPGTGGGTSAAASAAGQCTGSNVTP